MDRCTYRTTAKTTVTASPAVTSLPIVGFNNHVFAKASMAKPSMIFSTPRPAQNRPAGSLNYSIHTETGSLVDHGENAYGIN